MSSIQGTCSSVGGCGCEARSLHAYIIIRPRAIEASIFEQFQLKLESDLEWIVPPSPGQVDLKLESHKEWPLLPSPGKIDLQIGSPVEWPALPSTDQLRSPLPVLRQLKRKNLDSMPSKIVKCRRKLFIFL